MNEAVSQNTRHLIMGTAGHIDHGKTALIKKLTGIDCDTHREEKQRGITIHLGFAWLDSPDGSRIGIVDVPGHASFIRTMVAGASGIDFCLLVVAADAGVMPQTREHLQILDVLGVTKGCIAVTKTDLVEPDIAALAAEEVREVCRDTFLSGATVIPVSSKTGRGITALRTALFDCAAQMSTRRTGRVFRMFIDRIFVAKGFGPVVTGTVLSGRVAEGDAVYLLPGGDEMRIRRLERHGIETRAVVAGDRASLNCVGLKRERFKRGMLIADRALRETRMVDARLRLFPDGKQFPLWFRAVFYVGTYEAQSRIHCINSDGVRGGETALVQIHLPEPCILQAGDRFVVRSTSGDTTLGGGEIIDAFPLHHRRRRPAAVETMQRIAEGRLPELVAAEVRKRVHAVRTADIADILNVAVEDITMVVEKTPDNDMAVFNSGTDRLLLRSRTAEKWREHAVRNIKSHHRRHPLDPQGMPVSAIMATLGIGSDRSSEQVVRAILDTMVDRGVLVKRGNTWAHATHAPRITPSLQRKLDWLETRLRECGLRTPLLSELGEDAGREGIDEHELIRLLNFLAGKGSVYRIDGNYLHASIVDRARKQYGDALRIRPGGMTVAEFRDLIGGNRKICLLMLQQFDEEGVSVRRGDRRFSA